MKLKNTIKLFFIGVLIGFLFMMLTGCCQKQYPSVGSIVKDSISTTTTIIYKDTLVQLPGSTVALNMPYNTFQVRLIETEKTGAPIQKKEGKATMSAKLQNDTMWMQCDCDTTDILLQNKNTTINTQRQQQRTVVLPPEKYIPKWLKYLAMAGGASILLHVVKLTRII